MTPNRIPLNSPLLTIEPLLDQIIDRMNRVVRGGWWLNGEELKTFETAFAAYCGVPHCVGVANGTDGLELALRSIEAEDAEVITVANAGGYTTTACRLVGAQPVYVDVLKDRLVMDGDAVRDALTDRTRAIVATHLYGNLVDVPELRAILASEGREDVLIVEDGSQAHGAQLNGDRVGSMGDLAVFSFYPTKNLGALGDAGAVLTQHAAIADRLIALRQYGWTSRYESTLPFGRNSRMDEIQAGALNVKLPHLDAWNEERRAIILSYTEVLPPSIRMVTDTDGAAHLAVVRGTHRTALASHMHSLGIDTGIHFPTLDPDQPSQSHLTSVRRDLSNSETAQHEILTMPAYPGIAPESLERVASALASFSIEHPKAE